MLATSTSCSGRWPSTATILDLLAHPLPERGKPGRRVVASTPRRRWGYALVWGSWSRPVRDADGSRYIERIATDADLGPVGAWLPLLEGHDHARRIGRVRLQRSPVGLRAELDVRRALPRCAFGLSVGMTDTVHRHLERDGDGLDRRELRAARIVEVSVTSTPAHVALLMGGVGSRVRTVRPESGRRCTDSGSVPGSIEIPA